MRILLNIYKIMLFVLGFFIKTGLVMVNFLILNLVIDNFKK